ncbi:TPA: DUF2283 domain-containing protein [bacterium]|nr:DUF2283 domain-containing protein [bacterium]
MIRNQINIDYDPEGDILYVTFGVKGRKGTGYQLNNHIYIRIDVDSNEPLGLTVLDYQQILTKREIELSFWDEFEPKEKELIQSIVSKEPLSRFLSLKTMTSRSPIGVLQNLSLQEILAA